jgi:NAD(P)-dependent dehydrogenase (short-subunit alcohol dehydrogenase family)
MRRFEGKVAIVAGCGNGEGIGSTVSRMLAQEGAKVVVADFNLDAAKALEAQIRAEGGEAAACKADVSDEAEVNAMVALAVEKYGGLDCLHHNPAAPGPKGIMADSGGSLVDVDIAVFDYTMAVSARGLLLCIRAAVPEMLKRGGGAIVYTSSVAGEMAEPIRGAYGVAKAAGNAICRHIATAYGKRGIRANAVAPGVSLTHAARSPDDPFAQMQLRHHVTSRLGRAEDQAKMIVYLLSDDAGFITAQVFVVDGGLTTHLPAYADFIDGAGPRTWQVR